MDKMVPYPSGAIVPERDVDKRPVLETHHLGIDFGGLTAVDEFSLTVGKTEIAGLIGPNGAGKTTVFNLLTNVYQPSRGSIIFDRQVDCRQNYLAGETVWELRVLFRIYGFFPICRCLIMLRWVFIIRLKKAFLPRLRICLVMVKPRKRQTQERLTYSISSQWRIWQTRRQARCRTARREDLKCKSACDQSEHYFA